MRAYLSIMAAVLGAVASLAGCNLETASETRAERSGDAGLRLVCTPNPVVRGQHVSCAIREGGAALAATRWVFTNDEGRLLPPEQAGTGPNRVSRPGPA